VAGGNKVQLKIEARTSSSDETYKVHQLSLKAAVGSQSPSFPPEKSIDPKAGMQTGRGTLIIDGGSMKRQRNQATVKEFIKLVGGLDQPIVVSPTASQRVTDAEWAEYSDAWGKTIGFKHVSFMHAANHDPAEANTDAFVQDLKKARGLFMRGGRQWRLVNAYGNADNQTTALKEMWKLLERGGVIAGTSAGATVQGDFMPRGFTGGSGRMISRKAEHRRGFAFLLNVAFDVHVSERTRTTDLHQVLAYANERGQDLLGIGIDESTAIAVQGKVFRVIGSGRVFVHTFVEADEGNHVLILRSGDRYNLSTRENFVAAQHLD
jgi:cyanophycinase